MNIIEAWKAAKVGQKIHRSSLPSVTREKKDSFSGHVFCDALVDYRDGQEDQRFFDDHVLANDWEVVKEMKIFTADVTMHEDTCAGFYMQGKCTSKMKWKDINGKKGKLTFTWEE